jgi:fatty acid amide hydrolase
MPDGTPVSPDLCTLTATALADRIARGTTTSIEAVEAAIARIERHDRDLNAVVWKRFDEARREALDADRRRSAGEPLGPLHGVPVTVKECLDLEGSPSTFGLRGRAKHRAASDDAAVAAWRRAGAVVLGKTNVAQVLFYFETDNPLHGRCNNPWDLARSPGGSSGGEAAAIASGGSFLGMGTDLGGSVRVPAASCGLASMKPTEGRLPDPGRLSLPYGQRAMPSQRGVIARAVEDVTLGLRAASAASPEGVPALGDPSAVDLRRMRVGFFDDDGVFPAAASAKRAVSEAAAALAKAGATVTRFTPPDPAAAMGMFFRAMTADGGAGLQRTLRGEAVDPRVKQLLLVASAGPVLRALLQPVLRAAGRPGAAGLFAAVGRRDADHYWQLVEEVADFRERYAAEMAAQGGLDLLLCPAFGLPALRHGATEELGILGTYTVTWNVLGYPAGVVPVTRARADEEGGRAVTRDIATRVAAETERGSAGLPVGVQVVARPWREHEALAAMGAIESDARARGERFVPAMAG